MPPLVNIAIAQFSPVKGDYPGNLARLGEILAQVGSMTPLPQVLHLPETILTGYFLEGGVRDLAVPAGRLARELNDLFRAKVAGARMMDVVLGFYETWNNTLHNSAMCVTLGSSEPVIRHVHRKVFLPTYGLFDEERFVERGHEVRAFDTSWGRVAILICEDAWHSMTGTIAALDGAQIVLLCAAAPARGIWPRSDDTPGPYTLNRWERLARDIAEEHGIFVSLAHMVGSEAGKTFAGGSAVMGPGGEVLVRAPVFEEAIINLRVDINDITRARADMPLLSDMQGVLPHMLENIQRVRSRTPVVPSYTTEDEADRGILRMYGPVSGFHGDAAAASSESGGTRPLIQVVRPGNDPAGGPPPLEIDAEVTTDMLVSFIQKEFSRRGFSRAVIGMSGGVDSAVTAALAARALGPSNVIGVRLPYKSSSAESLEHAQLVIDETGIVGQTLDISAAVDGYLSMDTEADATRRGNVMSRMRMIALFDLSARHKALPLGTGNKTERLFGYFTWHADDAPPVNPIGDLYKTQVWALARHLGVPGVIADKPATADLVHGQTDEEDLGVSYAIADNVLNWLLGGYTPAELLARGFAADDIDVVARRLAATHWKRRLPTVAMVSSTAIGESYLRPVDY